MSRKPLYLILDGYTRDARTELADGGARLAGDLYRAMLDSCTPGGADCEVIFPSDLGAGFHEEIALDQFDGIAWTGCSLCVNEDSESMKSMIELTRRALDVGLPGFGSCFAAQIAVVAAGGEVRVNPNGREMGIARKICLTDNGVNHPMYEGKPAVFDGFTSHDDEIHTLPDGTVRLSGNAWTRVQSVEVKFGKGTYWGLQYHPEYDLHEMARLTYCRIDKLTSLGFYANREDALRHVQMMEDLHESPDRKDLAWQLGVDRDLLDVEYRQVEVRNWVTKQVTPLLNAEE